jgi:hypothetical protein
MERRFALIQEADIQQQKWIENEQSGEEKEYREKGVRGIIKQPAESGYFFEKSPKNKGF